MGNAIVQKPSAWRRWATSVSVVMSMGLVLFLLGLLGLLLVSAGALSTQVKENFAFQIFIKSDAKQADVELFRKNLELQGWVKETRFISKDEAAVQLKETLEEDFIESLGYNPLMDIVELRIKAGYFDPAKIAGYEADLRQEPVVEDISYDKPLLELLYRNLRKVGALLVVAALVLLFVALALIHASIRLSIYARRFILRTMQLVGATKAFIRKPFLVRGAIQGLLAGGLASVLVVMVYSAGLGAFPELMGLLSGSGLILVLTSLLALGLLLSLITTYFALRRYLNLTTDDLYA
jgi:cell division transport system permease protein